MKCSQHTWTLLVPLRHKQGPYLCGGVVSAAADTPVACRILPLWGVSLTPEPSLESDRHGTGHMCGG